ncbi:MAG: TetR/AcrR family transcriptional regulator [Rhizobiales bacterium]|nr:TetR/AcrR family transcriptional regulator [Hyphomicrobiales bacterium]
MARIRAQDYDEKRNSILKNAALLFADKGFAGASMSQLATHCNVSKATLYHYYSNKEAILFDVLFKHIEHLKNDLAKVNLADKSPEDRLFLAVDALLKSYEDADDTHRALINDLQILPIEDRRKIKIGEREIVVFFTEIIISNKPSLNDTPEKAMPLTMSLLGMLNWHYTWFKQDGPMTRQDYSKLACDLFLGGLNSSKI